MEEQGLIEANETLNQPNQTKPKKLCWLIISIVIASIVIIISILLYLAIHKFDTYPYIPVPRNTIRSTSIPEVISNMLLDFNETSPDYGVISRQQIVGQELID
jgi:hypothetical protein